MTPPQIPRIERLKVHNYRALRDVSFTQLTPLTVLTGPNGSGKSTVFDVFAFLSEAFTEGLRPALEARNRLAELRSRGSDGPVTIEITYRDVDNVLITYHLAISEGSAGRPIVEREWLRVSRQRRGYPPHFLDFSNGAGTVMDEPDSIDTRQHEQLKSADLLAVSALGQLERHPRISSLRSFITGWYLSYVAADSTRATPISGPTEHLSRSGDNLPNVVQYLVEERPDTWDQIRRVLADRVPQLQTIEAETLSDNRLLLRLRDAPFAEPIISRFVSDGTLKLLAYLTVLYDPTPAPFIGLEEPENQLHPRLLPLLAEECRMATEASQMLVTTHSPEFLSELRPDEVRVLYRDHTGYTQTTRVADMESVMPHVAAGANLGALWRQGYFANADPLAGAAPG
ncbi:MAG: AAA family ATPase [Ilumatobacter sp.]|uniref:AAA family ATPase n=1 Tax=Ilumatobacter sp. TaxID=1967498 RepID=UPI00391BCB92